MWTYATLIILAFVLLGFVGGIIYVFDQFLRRYRREVRRQEPPPQSTAKSAQVDSEYQAKSKPIFPDEWEEIESGLSHEAEGGFNVASEEDGRTLKAGAPATREVHRAEYESEEGPETSAPPAPVAKAGTALSASDVLLFFGTDRRAIASPTNIDFGPDRGLQLTVGAAQVTIPSNHRRGCLERPSILRLEFREDARRHIVLAHTSVLSVEQFGSAVNDEIHRLSTDQAFLFVHGFNVSFAEAARRAGQLAFDLQSFIPFVFSWPSRGETIDYVADLTSVRWCVPHLIEFVKLIMARTRVRGLHLIGHSMGVPAVAELIPACIDHVEIKELILAAADIDRRIFEEQIAPIVTAQRRTTVYACERDQALLMSKRLNRGYPRLGDCSDGVCVSPAIDTVDVSGVAHSILNHATVFDVRTMVEDLHRLMDNGMRAEKRGLIPKESERGRYWVVAPG